MSITVIIPTSDEYYAKYGKECLDSIPSECEVLLLKFDPKKEIPKDTVLVRMIRENFRYDIMGFTFTKEHPFVAMNQAKAQAIFDKEEGFRLATPAEVQEFYS